MKDFFIKNSLLFIDENGNNISIPKVEGEKDHKEAYTRVTNIYPQLMKDYKEDINISGGMALASYIAYKGKIVIWPASLLNSEIIIITLPERITNIQGEQLLQFASEQKIYKNHNVLATISSYTGNVDDMCWKVLSDSELDTKEKINNYIKLQKKLNDISTTTTEDIRTYTKKLN